jgi:hypothetical protein
MDVESYGWKQGFGNCEGLAHDSREKNPSCILGDKSCECVSLTCSEKKRWGENVCGKMVEHDQ